jgi:hypothetical protein
MTTLREAAQQALEALLRVQPQVRGALPVQDVDAAITALKAALAQEQVEPTVPSDCADSHQPVQEPVAWMWEQEAVRSSSGIGGWDRMILFCKPARDEFVKKRNVTPLYTTPPKRQPLTAEQILDLFDAHNLYGTKWVEFARAIERAHKIGGDE